MTISQYQLQNPWYDIYAPSKLSEIIMPPILRHKIELICDGQLKTNLLIDGQMGIGKTSILSYMHSQLASKHDILMLNIYDEKYNKQLQKNIFDFSKFVHVSPIKFIMIDELHNFNEKYQNIISNAIDNNDKIFVIAATANLLDVIEGLQSKCDIVKINKISETEIANRLEHICNKTNTKCSDDNLRYIAKNSDGDLRRAINTLQMMAITNDNKIDRDLIDVFYNKIDVDKLMQLICNKDLNKISKYVKKLGKNGHSYHDILQELFTYVKELDIRTTPITIHEKTIDIKIQAKMLESIGNAILIFNKGIENKIHFVNCILTICLNF